MSIRQKMVFFVRNEEKLCQLKLICFALYMFYAKELWWPAFRADLCSHIFHISIRNLLMLKVFVRQVRQVI